MTTYSAPRGPAPKPASQRRRRNTPKSYGAAEAVVAGQGDEQPPLGFDAHPLVTDLWAALAQSVESSFYSAADWQRARMELWFADRSMASGQPSANAWAAIQHGLSEMLLSPATKRRAGIDVRPTTDADADAADKQIARYKRVLKSV
jgi:hypothetical protein